MKEDTAIETLRNETEGGKRERTKHNGKLWDFKWPNVFVNVESLKRIGVQGPPKNI